MLQRFLDPVLRNPGGLPDAIGKDFLRAFPHGDAVGHRLQHGDIVFPVPDGIAVFQPDSELLLQKADAFRFRAALRIPE